MISDNKYGGRTFSGDNRPDRAHFWLPTVGHPSDKATCEFIITAPSHYQVIATGILYEETDHLLKVNLIKSCPENTTYLFSVDIGIYKNSSLDPEIIFVLMDSANKTIPMNIYQSPDSVVLDSHVWLLFENAFGKK